MNAMKTVAFASAAHEFRNPLNGIIQSLELLSGMIDLNICGKFFTTAKCCANLMLYLVNDILDFSQIEAKKFLLNYQPTNLREMIQECMTILAFKAEAKRLQLYLEIDEDVPQMIDTDQNRVRQILINLLSNALKYTQ